MNEITKKYKIKSIITFWLSLALNIIPAAVFIIMGISTVDVEYKVILSVTGVVALILGIIMLMSKAKMGRSLFWMVFLGLYFCMNNLGGLIIAMGVCTLIDDLVVKRLHSRYNEDYHTNKQIDKREKKE